MRKRREEGRRGRGTEGVRGEREMEEGRKKKPRSEERKRSRLSAWLPARCFHFPLSCCIPFIRSRWTEARQSLPRQEALL